MRIEKVFAKQFSPKVEEKMNIREIAQLAGVSISTVSKIINGKDQNISEQTKQRVLKIVKENHYAPYVDLRNTRTQNSLLLGALIDETSESQLFVASILQTAKAHSYQVIVCKSKDIEEERKNLNSLLAHRIDGLLLDCGEQTNKQELIEELQQKKTPVVTVDRYHTPTTENYFIDCKKVSYAATQVLIEHKHQRIICLAHENNYPTKRYFAGYQQCLYDNKLPFDASLCQICTAQPDVDDLMLRNATGFICLDAKTATMVYHAAARMNLRIPADISVILIASDDQATGLLPSVSSVQLPYVQLGEFACTRLIHKIEKTKTLNLSFQAPLSVSHHQSLDVPNNLRNKKIVVVGAINMDTLMNVGCYPKHGETIAAQGRVLIPGGKGINQAIGAARLGAEVYLIGKIGKDYDGSVLYDFLNTSNVNIHGVSTDPKLSTGHAYIYVEDSGESGIVIYNGANQNLLPLDISKYESVFHHASFCLLQTEIRMDTVEYAAVIAKKNGVKVLLKPAAISKISKTLLPNIDIFIPNINELNQLCKHDLSLEEKAQYFLDHGVKDIIVTLGNQGCYWRNQTVSKYFEAADFEAVDTTGACDAFAATLAVYLSRNYEMETAIQYATYAAGFSITRQGVPPSLVDQSTLELYLSDRF